MASGSTTSWQIDGETMETVRDFRVLGSKISADDGCSYEIKIHLLLGRKAMSNLDSILKSRDITLPTKVRLLKAMVFPVVMWIWELDYKDSWAPKNWYFWTVMVEKALESPLDSKDIQPVHPNGNQSWILIERTDAEAPNLWSPDAKNWLIWKDSDVGKDWRWEEKGTTEDEMVGWHHQLNGHEFEYALGVGDGQGGLACCSPLGCKKSDMTEQLNWTELNLLTLGIKICLVTLVLGAQKEPFRLLGNEVSAAWSGGGYFPSKWRVIQCNMRQSKPRMTGHSWWLKCTAGCGFLVGRAGSTISRDSLQGLYTSKNGTQCHYGFLWVP